MPLGAAEGAGQRRASGRAARGGARRELLQGAGRRAVALESQKHPQDRFLEYTFMQTMETLHVGRKKGR